MRTEIFIRYPISTTIKLNESSRKVSTALQKRLSDKSSLKGFEIRNFQYVFIVKSDVWENDVRKLELIFSRNVRHTTNNWDLVY